MPEKVIEKMTVAQRIKRALQQAAERKREVETAELEAQELFYDFVVELTKTTEGQIFKRVGENSVTTVELRQVSADEWVLLLVRPSKPETVSLARVTRQVGHSALWKVTIRNRGEHHTFSDGSKYCWIRDPADPRRFELRGFIEDELIGYVSG